MRGSIIGVVVLALVTLGGAPASACWFRPGFGSPVVVVVPCHQRRLRRDGDQTTPQAVAHNALCSRLLQQAVADGQELPRRCWR